jgi:serine/threonine protein kinase
MPSCTVWRAKAAIGAGGMGEVYRAKDTKLDREVAIKVLPAAFAQHPERLARFEREANVLASLDHPNIASIYAVEESSDGKALVMELVKGRNSKKHSSYKSPFLSIPIFLFLKRSLVRSAPAPWVRRVGIETPLNR